MLAVQVHHDKTLFGFMLQMLKHLINLLWTIKCYIQNVIIYFPKGIDTAYFT